jgi:GNAT superfamily N-acetyltransferase
VSASLRPANQEDACAIARIHVAARRHSLPYLPDLHSDDETYCWIKDIVLPSQKVWVAQRDDVVVGYIALDGVKLNDLYVLPRVHGQGIGSALLAKAKELSPNRLTLWTFQRNERARDFYERRGFTAVKFTNGDGNEEHEPDVRYEWSFSASEIDR